MGLCILKIIIPSILLTSILSFTASPPQKPRKGWNGGSPPVSRKAKNSALAADLPSFREGICKSFAEFTRYPLGYTRINPEYPDQPLDIQIETLPRLTKEAILNDQSVFVTYTSVNHPNPADWSTFKQLLHTDLNRNGIGGPFTFEWFAAQAEKSHWNQVMIFFTVKHWVFAHRAGAFAKFAMQDKHQTENIHIGIMTRWVIGRIEEIRSEFHSPEKVLQRERNRKRRDVS